MSVIGRSLDVITFSDHIQAVLRRRLREGAGVVIIGAAFMATVALATWSVQDPSFSHATNAPIHNLLGPYGAKTADLFQGRHLGAILGVISIGTGVGAAAGAWASGLIFDLSGSYRLAFILSIVSYLAGCVAFWFLRRPPVSRL